MVCCFPSCLFIHDQTEFAELIWARDVSSVVSREAFYAAKSGQFVDETFKGSLPAFIAAFASGKKLSRKEVDEIQQMIDDFREEVDD